MPCKEFSPALLSVHSCGVGVGFVDFYSRLGRIFFQAFWVGIATALIYLVLLELRVAPVLLTAIVFVRFLFKNLSKGEVNPYSDIREPIIQLYDW